MSGGPGLEQRYRRVLRLLPGYYRDAWEEDMVAAFLDSWLTGDPEVDPAVLKFCRPSLGEVASVAGLAARRSRYVMPFSLPTERWRPSGAKRSAVARRDEVES